MSKISSYTHKQLSTYKSHLMPSVVTAGLALAVAVPMTAALSSNTAGAAADNIAHSREVAFVDTGTCTPGTGVAHTGSTGVVLGTGSPVAAVNHGNGNGNSGNGNGNSGNGNGNAGNGNGNTNGNGAQANGNTQSNVGGLIGGVNAIAPVSVLNGSLNNVASGNTVDLNALNNVTATVPAVVGVVGGVLGGLGL